MKLMVKGAITGMAVLLVIQLIPYGRDHRNPPVISEPRWDSPATRQLAKRACFNCHSFETVWPWYASLAPASWLVSHDVLEGRGKLNFSSWQNGVRDGESPAVVAKQIREGAMPPWQYLLAHPEARLSLAEKKLLSDGLQATIKGSLK